MNFGERLRNLRMQAGLSQEKLGNALGITKRTIIKYETGVCLPATELLPKISKFFGVTIDSLITDQEIFVSQAHEQGGSKGARDASALVEEVSGLFAGGRLSENDKDAVMMAIQNAYWVAKEESRRKYTPKKYRKNEET